MIIRHHLPEADSRDVWAVQNDGFQNPHCLVRATSLRPAQATPRRRLQPLRSPSGPLRQAHRTPLPRCEEGRRPKPRIHAHILATTRSAVESPPASMHCLVLVEQHPHRQAAAPLDHVTIVPLIRLRHRTRPNRLPRVHTADASLHGWERGRTPAAAAVTGWEGRP